MDLLLFLRVIWSRKWIMLLGLILAGALAFLSFVRVDPSGTNHFHYRQTQQWASYTTLFVTQKGFPWGTLGATTGVGTPNPTHATDPNRFISLALIYSQLIPSDGVRQIMLKSGPIDGTVEAAALTDPNNTNDALPLISVAGLSDTPQHATQLVRRATAAFLAYLEEQQSAAGTPAGERVVVQVIRAPGRPKLLADRSTTLPIVVFITMVLATIAICFILENLHPRVRAEGAETATTPSAGTPVERAPTQSTPAVPTPVVETLTADPAVAAPATETGPLVPTPVVETLTADPAVAAPDTEAVPVEPGPTTDAPTHGAAVQATPPVDTLTEDTPVMPTSVLDRLTAEPAVAVPATEMVAVENGSIAQSSSQSAPVQDTLPADTLTQDTPVAEALHTDPHVTDTPAEHTPAEQPAEHRHTENTGEGIPFGNARIGGPSIGNVPPGVA